MEEIRRLLPIECWRHCPGVSNPADIPSRGSKPSDLISNPLWWNGPEVIDHEEVPVEQVPIPDECLNEMKSSHDKVHINGSNGLFSVIHYEDFSVLGRLLQVTAYFFRFTQLLVTRFKGTGESIGNDITACDILKAETHWIRESQMSLVKQGQFESWRKHFHLFVDEAGVLRCGGRLNNANIPFQTKHPILLNSKHHITTLIIKDCHEKLCIME